MFLRLSVYYRHDSVVDQFRWHFWRGGNGMYVWQQLVRFWWWKTLADLKLIELKEFLPLQYLIALRAGAAAIGWVLRSPSASVLVLAYYFAPYGRNIGGAGDKMCEQLGHAGLLPGKCDAAAGTRTCYLRPVDWLRYRAAVAWGTTCDRMQGSKTEAYHRYAFMWSTGALPEDGTPCSNFSITSCVCTVRWLCR